MLNILMMSWPHAKHIKALWSNASDGTVITLCVVVTLFCGMGALVSVIHLNQKWSHILSGALDVIAVVSIICVVLSTWNVFGPESSKQVDAADNVGCYRQMKQIKYKYPTVTLHSKITSHTEIGRAKAIRTYKADHYAYQHTVPQLKIWRKILARAASTKAPKLKPINNTKSLSPKVPRFWQYL